MINILRQMRKFLVQLMNQLPFLIMQFIDWYHELTRLMNPFSFILLHFSGENWIWYNYVLFITEWLSLDTSAVTTSRITLDCLLVCWDWFVYWRYMTTSSWSLTRRSKYIFYWQIFLNNILNITFTWNINHFFSLEQLFFFISLCFDPWTLNFLSCSS